MDAFVNFYKKFFTKNTCSTTDKVLEFIPKIINQNDNEMLLREV